MVTAWIKDISFVLRSEAKKVHLWVSETAMGQSIKHTTNTPILKGR